MIDTNTIGFAVMAESVSGAPIQLIMVDPSGSVLSVINGTNGIAVMDVTTALPGNYLIKVVNLGIGPMQVNTTTTPYVVR